MQLIAIVAKSSNGSSRSSQHPIVLYKMIERMVDEILNMIPIQQKRTSNPVFLRLISSCDKYPLSELESKNAKHMSNLETEGCLPQFVFLRCLLDLWDDDIFCRVFGIALPCRK
ncbi:hypothetical protein ABG067_005746 [Albugo candida]